VVIASSVSNGAAAGLRALEQDRKGLIDGFAGTEPNLNPDLKGLLAVQQGAGPLYRGAGKPLYDYYGVYNVYQGCANVAFPPGELLNITPTELGENVCRSLREKGLLRSDTIPQQAEEAQSIINAHGILPEQNIIQPGNWAINVPQGIGVTYANSYARSRPQDRLCGYSFAATDAGGLPVALAEVAEQALFATSNGIPPTGGINLINDGSLGGPLLNRDSLSLSSDPPGRQDQNLDGALCQRSLWNGRNPVTGQRLEGPMQAKHVRLRAGIDRILASADLRGRPALIATGRADQVVAPNHASRAYYGRNRQIEGSRSRLAYIEVTNAQHLDTLNGNPEFGARYVPLHHYFVQVLNLMYSHLTGGSSLPPSQVIHTVQRGTGGPGGTVPDLTAANLPEITQDPPASARITFSRGVVRIPE
jgi:hydroxybutyrate-dimer hydrolase